MVLFALIYNVIKAFTLSKNNLKSSTWLKLRSISAHEAWQKSSR